MSVHDFSTTASNNGSADASINFAENQAASTLNDSARVLMKRIKELCLDLGCQAATTGAGNAYLLTPNASIQTSGYYDGLIVGAVASFTNSSTATLNVESKGAKTIYANNAVLTGGEVVSGAAYWFAYDSALNGGSGGFHLLNPKPQAASATVASIISVTDNTNAALRITQLGTANALLVEDNTNPDSTPFVIDASGNVVIGHTAILSTFPDIGSAAVTAKEQLHGGSAGGNMKAIAAWSNDTVGPGLVLAKARSATIGTYTVVQNGDTLGYVNFAGTDGVDFAVGAQIRAVVAAAPGSNDMPTKVEILTTPDGSATPAVAITVNENGKLVTKATTATASGFNVPNGTAPSSPVTGDIWAVSGVLKYYNGTTSLTIVTDPYATAAEHRSATASRVLTSDVAWSAAAEVSLTDAATIAVDMSSGWNFAVTLGGNRTLGNPTNTKVGQSGYIRILQDGTGSRTLAYSSNWKFPGAVAPVLTTTANRIDYLFYTVRSATEIVAFVQLDVR